METLVGGNGSLSGSTIWGTDSGVDFRPSATGVEEATFLGVGVLETNFCWVLGRGVSFAFSIFAGGVVLTGEDPP
jgi:hypothetical protein